MVSELVLRNFIRTETQSISLSTTICPLESIQSMSNNKADTSFEPCSIIVLALSGLGDALMASPALRAVRERFPKAQIDILTMFRPIVDIYKSNTSVNNVIYWNFLKENPILSLKFVLSLRKKRYDASLVVFPANRWPYNVISCLIGAKTRLGHDYLHVNTRSLNALNNSRVLEDDALHNVEENLRLSELLEAASPQNPKLEITVAPLAVKEAELWLEANKIKNNELVVGIHAGSAVFKNQINKRWSASGYAEIAQRLTNEYHARVLLFGGPEEVDLNASIAEMSGSKATIVQTSSFQTTIALMQRCGLFVSNDSGLMHVAAALDLPTVAIFAYTSHVHTRPWCSRYIVVRHDLPCSPCFYFSPRPVKCKWSGDDEFMCIRRITSNEVYAACKELLQ